MRDEVTADDLLTAWQDAMLAADLAERLAKSALEAADLVDRGAVEAEAIASLAERAAASAEVVAATARAAAERARHEAGQRRTSGVADAEVALGNARAVEGSARERWRATTRVDATAAAALASAHEVDPGRRG